jgi:glyoxylase-like metal-dependent hydrolase (beta-lactamase superfamily II)/rhodanese-related sulfurtransferase
MFFRQLFDRESCTYTYLLADPQSKEAVIIDPVKELHDRDAELIEALHFNLTHCVETHVHADHVTGSGLLARRFGAQSVVAAASGATWADLLVEDGDVIRFGKYLVEVNATPGHTNGCITLVTADRKMAFTGDALFVRGCGRTDFQQGDARTLFRSIRDKIFSLPDDTMLYPGHDYQGRTATTVWEEKAYNPRLASHINEDAFVGIMDNLNLANPRLMDVAVPANLQGGLTEADRQDSEDISAGPWAPIHRSGTGVPEVEVTWVADHLDSFRVIDVRQPAEFEGELKPLPGAVLFPLDTVVEASRDWDKAAATILVCRSGGRSGRAALELENLGFSRVASMAGGLLAWRDAGLDKAAAQSKRVDDG